MMKTYHFFRKNALVLALSVASPAGFAQDGYQFNPMFLAGKDGDVADLSWLEKGTDLPPGKYNTTIFINDKYIGNADVTFITEEIEGQHQLLPCFNAEEVDGLGIDLTKAKSFTPQQDCLVLDKLYESQGVKRDFDAGKLVLRYTLPQEVMLNRPRGEINPSRWEKGITTGFLSYNMTGSRSEYSGENDLTRTNYFVGLNSGINWGPWRLRDNSTWSWANQNGGQWSHISTMLQRDIVSLRSQLTLGDTWSSSSIFDAAGVRGVQLASSENMLPNSQRGYAPEVRGIARTNATVRISQNGNLIYQTSVTPGAFVINDLYPTSSGGDLDVSIEENDGQVTRFTVPFASVPNLVRQGQVNYSLSAGNFRSGYNQSSPFFLQGDIFYGWRYGLTFYGGAQYSDNYQAWAAGIGQNLGRMGAYSVDAIHANSTLANNKSYSGDSIRFRYGKTLNTTGTSLNFYSWHYTSRGYYTLSDTAYRRMRGGENQTVIDENGQIINDYSNYYNLGNARKLQNQVLLSQQLGNYGSLALSYNQQSYWNTSKTTDSIRTSYSTSWKSISWNLAWQHTRNVWSDKSDDLFSFSMSMPLSKFLPDSRIHYGVTNSTNADTSHSLGVNGKVPGYDNFNYGVNARYGAGNNDMTGGDMSLQYQGSKGVYNAAYSQTRNSRYYNAGISGGVVLHEDGVTLSQPLGNTNILVKAPGAANVKINNQTGIYTDSRGYAVVPYASAYRENRVNLDVRTLGVNVEVPQSIVSTIPTEGAMVRATMDTRIGYRALFMMVRDGKALPFGTPVALQKDDTVSGIVGETGVAWLAGLPEKGTLLAKWGTEPSQQCVAQYSLKKENYDETTNLYTQELICK